MQMPLEELLALLQSYGVTSYADKEIKIELAQLHQAVDYPETGEDFGLEIEALRVVTKDN